MKISRFSEPQILGILHQEEDGVPVPELCRLGGSSQRQSTTTATA